MGYDDAHAIAARKFSVEPFSKVSQGLGAAPPGDLRRGRNFLIVQKRPRGECSIRKRMGQRETTSGLPLLSLGICKKPKIAKEDLRGKWVILRENER